MAVTLASVLAFIGRADFFTIARIQNAAHRRRAALPTAQPLSQSQARTLFPVGSTIEIFGTANDAINGRFASVEQIGTKAIHYKIGDHRGEIFFSCAIPIEAEEASQAPTDSTPLPDTGMPFVVNAGKLIGKRGVIISRSKRRFNVVMRNGEKFSMPAGMMSVHNPPEVDVQLLLQFSIKGSEHGRNPFGSAWLYDLRKADPAKLLETGKPLPEGITDFGWITRSEATALARGLGARLE